MEIELLLTIVEFRLRRPRCQKRRWKHWRGIVQIGGISLRPHETSGCYDDDDDYDEFHGAKSGESTKTSERNGGSDHRITTLPAAHSAILHPDLAFLLFLRRPHSSHICSGSIQVASSVASAQAAFRSHHAKFRRFTCTAFLPWPFWPPYACVIL